MPLRKKKSPETAVQTVGDRYSAHPFSAIDGYSPLATPQYRLYEQLREAVPVIDAAIMKIVRLTGGFTVSSGDGRANALLEHFVCDVPVGGNQNGIGAFASSYLEQLLTYGTAVGEVVMRGGNVAGLYNAPLENIELHRASDGFGVEVYTAGANPKPVKYPELILLSTLNPQPHSARRVSCPSSPCNSSSPPRPCKVSLPAPA